jgi:hypothetical protein
MNSRSLGIAFVGVLVALAWFSRPSTPYGAPLGWYVAGWVSIAAGAAALWSGRLLQGKARLQVLVLLGALLLADLFWSQPRVADLAVIAVAATVVTVLIVFQGQHTPLLEYLWLLRFPLMLAAVLALLPFIFESFFPSFLANLLVLRAVDLVIVTMLAVVVARATAFSADLIVRFGHKRTHVSRWPRLERITGFLVHSPAAGLLAMPLVFFALARCTSPLWASLPLVAVGVLLAEALVWFGRFVAAYLGPESSPSSPAMPTDSKLLKKAQQKTVAWAASARESCHTLVRQQPEWIREGYCDESDLHPGLLTVTFIALATLVVYLSGYFAFFPENHTITGWWEPPALAYVLVLLMLLTWGLSAASFFLDRWRVSAALVIASIPFVLFFVHDLDHYYGLPETSGQIVPAAAVQTLARVAEPEERREIRTAFTERLRYFKTRHPDREPVVVAVAASGGGITASLWTATVLEGLQQDFGPAFADSLHFISSVSGGSVGTMHYVDGFRDGAPPQPGAAVTRAARSSLSAVAWGMAYPDFWRAFSLRHPHRWEIDRGWAMEQRWAREITGEPTLSLWRADTMKGWRPPVLFNATVVETGERLIMSSLHVNTLPDDCTPADDGSESSDCESGLAARTHFTLFGEHDLKVVSAARLSATFPFVSPIARARVNGVDTAYHVADGGYYDNFGVVTLIEWARKLVRLTPKPAEHPVKPRLLIVEIRQSDSKALTGTPPKDRAGWTYATIGPLSTMLNVRQSSQATRNDLEIQLLTDWAASKGWTIKNAVFVLSQDSPMSWHLSEEETNGIQSQWAACKARPGSTIAKAWNTVRDHFPAEAQPTSQPWANTENMAGDCGEVQRPLQRVASARTR